jgi:hypothetical protein
VLNISSEAPDPLLFAGIGWDPYNPFAIPPLGGGQYISNDCFNITYSAISQALADLLAANNAALCMPGPPGVPNPPLPPWPPLPAFPDFNWTPPVFVPPDLNYQQFANERQEATASCPNGAIFTYAVEAGTLLSSPIPPELGPIMVQLLNAQAMAFALQQVWAMRVCIEVPLNNRVLPTIPTTPPLPPSPPGSPPSGPNGPSLAANPAWCCFGEALDPIENTYSLGHGSAAFTFSVGSGMLAPGTSLVQINPRTAEITGTPSAPGVYIYTIIAVQNGNPTVSVKVTDTLKVFGLMTSSLPNGAVGTPYSEQLATAGGTAPVTFALVGTLPDGLTLSATGLISGTPTTDGTSSFTVQFTDSEGGTCQEDLSITVATIVPGACDAMTKTYQVTGYSPAIAANVASFFPSAPASALPEWDGIFRDDGSGSKSHSECYAINGKSISLSMILTTVKQDVSCHISGFDPLGWAPEPGHILPNTCINYWPSYNGCALVYSGATAYTIVGTDTIDTVTFAHVGGVVGTYGVWTSPLAPDCSSNALGATVESFTVGATLFTIAVYP